MNWRLALTRKDRLLRKKGGVLVNLRIAGEDDVNTLLVNVVHYLHMCVNRAKKTAPTNNQAKLC